jgi:hypothetical protein
MRYRLLTLLPVLLGLTTACVAIGPDRGNFGTFARSLSTTSWGYSVIEDPTGTAPAAIVERFEVRPGDCAGNDDWDDCANDRERSELSQRGDRNPLGSEYWYGWSFYLAEDYPNVHPTKTALGQFHQHDSHPVWMFQNSSGGLSLDDQVTGRTRQYHKLIDQAELLGRWHRIEVHARWSRGDDGLFDVYVNGEEKVRYRGPTMSASITYFKYGVYRSFMSRYRNAKGVGEVPGQTALYANVRRANTREGLVPR